LQSQLNNYTQACLYDAAVFGAALFRAFAADWIAEFYRGLRLAPLLSFYYLIYGIVYAEFAARKLKLGIWTRASAETPTSARVLQRISSQFVQRTAYAWKFNY
jgi:hypothetical protein